MGFIDIYNIEGGDPPNKISWTTLAGVILGWLLKGITDFFVKYYKMVKVGNRFRQQIENSKKGYKKQLDSINNLIAKLKNSELDSLSLHLLQQFNTIKSLDKSIVLDYFESWWYILWHKKADNRPEHYVDTAYSIIENSALEMKRLESMFVEFRNQMDTALSSYAKEVHDMKNEIDKVLETTSAQEFANDIVLKTFGNLYVANFFTSEQKMRRIDMKMFQDLLIDFHSPLNVTFPIEQDNPLYRKIKDFNHSSSWIINTFNHTREQIIGQLELIEGSMKDSYNKLYGTRYEYLPEIDNERAQ